MARNRKRVAFLSRVLLANLYVTTKKDRIHEATLPKTQAKPIIGQQGKVVGQYAVDGVLGVNKRDVKGSKFSSNEFLIATAESIYPSSWFSSTSPELCRPAPSKNVPLGEHLPR